MSWVQPGQEAGEITPDGTRWYHHPWEGWQRDERPQRPYLTSGYVLRRSWWRRLVRTAGK